MISQAAFLKYHMRKDSLTLNIMQLKKKSEANKEKMNKKESSKTFKKELRRMHRKN
jgi:hypothetical protein